MKSGWDYRWHFDEHLDEYDMAVDKQLYIQQTTNIAEGKLLNQIDDNSRSNRHSIDHSVNNMAKMVLRRLGTIIKMV